MKKLITENDIIQAARAGNNKLYVEGEYLITPLAKDAMRDYKVEITLKAIEEEINSEPLKRISIGSDHTGFALKKKLKEYVAGLGYDIIDVGTNSEASCDYPDYAMAVANPIIKREVDFGIMIDASGNPSAMTMNSIPGIRAAVCYNEFTAWSAKAHNNANAITIGAKAIGEEAAKFIIKKLVETEYEGGRHQKRLDKISELESKLLERNS